MEEKKYTRKEYTPMRKAISNAMHSSISQGSQLSMMYTFDATNLLKVRSIIKEKHEELNIANASINEIIMYVLGRVIKANPSLNGHIGDGYFDEYEDAHISLAVDTPKGLITPVLWDVSTKSLSEISNDSKEAIAKAMEGKLRLSDIQGGTITISNLGLSGVQFFTPILNPPQAAIVGVGSPIKRVKLVDGNPVEYPEITLSLTMDHGPNDGIAGTKFINELGKALTDVNEDILK